MTTQPHTRHTANKPDARYHVCGMGHSIVDILAETPEETVAAQAANGMIKGSMMLIDAPRARAVYDIMPQSVAVSGGSAGNTMACLGSFGGKGAFIGLVADDQFGKVYRHDMHAQNIAFTTPPIAASNELASAQCLILITPDAQRTMNTYLGASSQLGPEQVDEEMIAQSQYLYMEGYLYDQPHNKAAFAKALELAKKHGTKVAVTLSDSFCVERHRADFLTLIRSGVDLVFANHLELMGLYETTDLALAIEMIRKDCPLSAVTLSEKGSLVITADDTIQIDAIPPAALIDTTGAGDAYAGGFLYGLTHGKDLATCGAYGSLAASEVISHIGPRPQENLANLLNRHPALAA